VVLDAGRIVLDGTAEAVLSDPRLEGWGVAAPSRIRIGVALEARRVDPAIIDVVVPAR